MWFDLLNDALDNWLVVLSVVVLVFVPWIAYVILAEFRYRRLVRSLPSSWRAYSQDSSTAAETGDDVTLPTRARE